MTRQEEVPRRKSEKEVQDNVYEGARTRQQPMWSATLAAASDIRPSSVPARGMAKRTLPHKEVDILIYM